jgi:hypothetical protein
MVSKPNKIDYLCPECGSADVTSDASAEWDVENQRWVLRCVYDSMCCNDCELDSNHGFEPTPIKEAPLSQDSIEAYEKDVANGVVPPGRHPKYENGVMVPQPVDKAVAEPVNEPVTKLAIPASPFIKLIQDGQIIDTSEFDLVD